MVKGYHSGILDAAKIYTDKYEGPSIVTLGLLGTVALSFPFDAVTSTEAAAAYCKVYDASATTYSNLAATNTNYPLIYTAGNYQLFPTTEGIGDIVYFGNSSKFGAMYIDMSAATVTTYSADAAVWEYYDGDEWVSFTPYDYTDSTAQDGKRPFQRDGYIILSVGTDWTDTTINTQLAFWVRCRLTAATVTQAGLTNSVEHKVTTLDYGSRFVTDGRMNRLVFRWGTNSASNNDALFRLVNMSKGTSVSLTHTKNKQNFAIDLSSTPLDVTKNDKVALFCTQVDGTTEFANGTVEIELIKKL